MKVSVRAGILFCGVATLLTADTLTLRNGTTVQGTYLGGTARQVRMDLNGDIRTYDIGQVQSVTFNDQSYQPSAPPRAAVNPPAERTPREIARDRDRDRDDDNRQSGLTIPADTVVTVRMIDSVNSETARLGETFRASLDEPVVVNGREVIPGARTC